MKKMLISILLVAILLLQMAVILPSNGTSEDTPVEYDNDKQFMRWNRDTNGNGIDDLIDSRMNDDPDQKVDIYVDYDHHPNDIDRERLEHFLDISYAPRYIDTLCALDVPLENLGSISRLPGVIMVEEMLPLMTQLDVSTRALKARESNVYSKTAIGSFGYDGFGVTVAVLDTGVDDSHPTFTDRLLGAYDATLGAEQNSDDAHGHGTHVAGIILGQGGGDDDPDNNLTGVAPGAKLIDVKVQNTDTGVGQNFISGVEWCIDQADDNREWDSDQREYNGIDIISVSLGDGSDDDGQSATAQIVNEAVDHGIVVVCAVGDSNGKAINAPGSADRAITVGATDDSDSIGRGDDAIWTGSNTGRRADDNDADHMDELKPEVVAPGVDIMSASNNHEVGADYTEMTGTSQATPHVAGTVALMLHARPFLEPDEGVKNIDLIFRRESEFLNGFTDEGDEEEKWNETIGYGLVDAYRDVWYSVTGARIDIINLRFSDDDANEDQPQAIEFQVGEIIGIDVGGGVIRGYDGSVEEKNLVYERVLDGITGDTTISDTIDDYKTKGGENKIILTVKEVEGAPDVQEEITMTGNYKPIAVIYTDDRNKVQYNVEPMQTVNFHGDASHDEEHHDLTYRFDMDDGTIHDYSTTTSFDHQFENGRYDVSLKVRDEYHAVSDTDKVVVTANLDPTADAGEDMMAGRGEPVSFKGVAYNDGDHNDSNDDIVLYEWDFDGNGVYEFEDEDNGHASHTYDEVRSKPYVAKFRVTDKWGAQAEDNINVTVVEGKPPEADAGADISAEVDTEVQFHGTAEDEDGEIEKYEWDFGDGSGFQNFQSGDATHIYDSHGSYTAEFRVTDSDDNMVSDTTKVKVHRAPVAVIKYPEDDGTYDSDKSIQFDATGSYDPDGTALTYYWYSDRDGQLGTEKIFSATLRYGRHDISLEVTDGDGGKHTTEVSIGVKDASDTPPSVEINSPGDGSWHQEEEQITFRATGEDVDGDQMNFSWEIGEDSYNGRTIVVSLDPGEHEVTAYADDGRGGIGKQTITVNVNRAPKAVINDLDLQHDEGTEITFDASKSTDPEGHEITLYTWYSDLDGLIETSSNDTTRKTLGSGTHNITLTVRDLYGGEGITYGLVIVRNAIDYNIELSAPDDDDKTVTYLEPAYFSIDAENDGYSDQTVYLTFSTIPEDWTVSFWNVDEKPISGGIWGLEGKDRNNKGTFIVKVTCPRDAVVANSLSLQIIADMGEGVRDIVDLKVTVGVFKSHAVGVNAESMLIDEAGDSLELDFTVTNRGNWDDTFIMDSNAPPGWKVTFDPSEPFVLAPDATQTVKVKVRSPSGGKKGEEIFLDIYAISTEDDSKNESATTQLRILAEAEEDSPGFGTALALMAFGLPTVSGFIKKRKKKWKMRS